MEIGGSGKMSVKGVGRAFYPSKSDYGMGLFLSIYLF